MTLLPKIRRSPSALTGTLIILFLLLVALFAPWLAPYDPVLQNPAQRLLAPDAQHWLGTDSYGRDVLSRLIYGTRPMFGLVALVAAITLPAASY